jgi:tetratricopeptide (TPR) repeat protein
VSLLLDALKRAEQEKLAKQGEAAAATPPPTLRDAAPRASAPAASLELQPMSSGAQGTQPAANASKSDARAAQTVFTAKAANGESRGRGMLWATVGAIAVVAIAAGAYVWYSVRSLTPQTFQARPRPAAAPTAAPAGSQQPQPPAAEAQLAAALSSPPVVPQSATPPPGATPSPPATTGLAPPTASLTPRAPREDAIAKLLRDSAAAPTAEPLRLDRAAQPSRQVPAEVSSGYEALRQGNLSAARRDYELAIAAHPSNLDALLGLATVESRAGNRQSAALNYRRALDVDPRNATALAGLAALAGSARPEAVEAQLRSDISRQPDSAQLRFALANLLASESRWSEAQSEYYEAHRLDPGSPEIMHNLAVSLDRLGQGRMAAGFYRRALEASRGQAPPFDRSAVARRLEELR